MHNQRFPTKMIFSTDVSCNLQPFFAGFHHGDDDDDIDGKDTLIGMKIKETVQNVKESESDDDHDYDCVHYIRSTLINVWW